MRALPLLLPLCLASGCAGLLDRFLPAGPECDPRSAYWRDADGDGVGDPGVVYLGCEAPPGYVDVPPPADTDAPDDTDPPAETDPPEDTDTGRPDRTRG